MATIFLSNHKPTNSPDERTQNMTDLKCPTLAKGDFDCNAVVDLADFDIWLNEYASRPKIITADANSDSRASLIDYEIWREGFLAN